MSKIYNPDNYEKINKKIEEDKILDHYVDISVCSEASGLRVLDYMELLSPVEKKVL